jgi:hypothetical protein
MNPDLDTALLWPAIAQAALIAGVYGLLGLVRQIAIRRGEVDSSDFPPWQEPPASAEVRRHLANQFELPVLFFAVVTFLTITGAVSNFTIVTAWLYVAFRLAHTWGALRGPLIVRHSAFTAAIFMVAILWLLLILKLLGL